jgi:crotonobetainyl-CoA:carnitine CoA-transferase CaiB-like acyl-CoA transferase
MRFADAEVGPKGPAPKLGQHTREILSEAGHGMEEIEALVEQGAIGESA